MAPIFSREVWRCVWHLIQVKILFPFFYWHTLFSVNSWIRLDCVVDHNLHIRAQILMFSVLLLTLHHTVYQIVEQPGPWVGT
jgi:hypothetical protein